MTQQKQSQKLILPVQGMTCTNCAARVEAALRKIPGVSDVMVDLKTNQARLNYDPTVVDLADLRNAILGAGYTVPTETIILKVSGMSCVSCLAHVEGALQDLPGILEATVSLNQGTAQVVYISNMVNPAQMEEAVQKAGYEAHAQETEDSKLDLGKGMLKPDHLQSGGNGKEAESASLFSWMRKALRKPGSYKG